MWFLRSFFQGAVNDIGSDFRDDHVRIHFHLRNEIMIGKKKANNVQFISQVRKKPLNSQLSTNLLAFDRLKLLHEFAVLCMAF